MAVIHVWSCKRQVLRTVILKQFNGLQKKMEVKYHKVLTLCKLRCYFLVDLSDE